MRYPPDQKAKAREAILEAGAQALRTNGFNGIGVDGLAAAAGVTSGAFYSNFPNKEALLEGVIEACLGKPFVYYTGSVAERRELLRKWLFEYISAYHRENPAVGCVMPTLSADVARASPVVREAYRLKMEELIGKVSTVLGGAEADRERRAWSIVAMMVGAIGISRAMPDGEGANRAIEHALETAISLIG
ncbi:TetR/AcrR family transcriptional regulator [Mesorhizobium sp. AR10]|uniref:TetR/AcrR family transcriptional regulator n=1 Tax=Mesorhizobium sp. AR10 TaxID=2865839 RepID=UPI00215E19B3|nr:TetR/AcrR family transcriptional regulator [Mesorhizobium sp. AR10]UVK40698.1 TetR/AcrR family transcriptional regulator [Mesorhizobium sp. AR10]